MKNNSGFTLIELMTIIAIIGITSAMVIPNLISWRINHQLNASAREVLSVINGARVAAIKNNGMATVTFDVDAKQVTAVFSNRFTGVERTTATLLKPGIGIDSNFESGAFRFNSRGLPVDIANPLVFAAGTVTLTNARGDHRYVKLASTGVTRIDMQP